MSNSNQRSIWNFSTPQCLLHLTEKTREAGVYTSGGLFALGWWFFIDAVVYSNHLRREDDTVPAINFEEWMCGILSTLGMIIINLINKSHLTTAHFYDSEGNSMYKARLFLFVGFAALAGGLAGSFTILILKYIVVETPHTYFGIALIIQNLSIMFSTVILWISQSVEDTNYNSIYL